MLRFALKRFHSIASSDDLVPFCQQNALHEIENITVVVDDSECASGICGDRLLCGAL
jgi:hypothetical protein